MFYAAMRTNLHALSITIYESPQLVMVVVMLGDGWCNVG